MAVLLSGGELLDGELHAELQGDFMGGAARPLNWPLMTMYTW
ncbi:hypothetical protein [Pseudomonas aeruginosa]|nr:hypothetical protein [Pseudomonas aeruginosa]AWF63513.1 hypothetical protein CSC27_0008 [Pseudomonas aeruginosa]